MIHSEQRRHARALAVFLAIGLVLGQAFAVEPAPELPDPGQTRMTREQQQQLGLQVAAEVYSKMPVLSDSSVETKYIQDLGKRLVATIPPQHSWPFQFHVVAQKEVNAFALPGGVMFVNIGTVTAVDNEAQLAGVMAHEMAHVYMQHSAKQQEKGSLLEGLAGLAGAVAGAAGGTWGTLAQTGIQFGAGTLMLKYSRGDEAQADAVGAIILWKAGFNPVALADFFQKMEKQGGSGPQFLSDHPNPGNRMAAIQEETRNWPPRKYVEDSPEFVNVRKHAATVRSYTGQEIAAGAKTGQWAGENRNNGAVFADAPAAAATQPASAPVPAAAIAAVRPSRSFRRADLGIVRIDRPENWEIMGGQQSSATIAPRAGVSGSGVAYGVVIRTGRAPSADMSTSQLTTAVVESLRGSDPNMRQVEGVRQVKINGTPAGSAILETISPMAGPDGRRQRERDWVVAVPRGQGDAIFFVFVAPQSHFDEFRPAFERMLRSIQF
jgi:hypothetical protein